MLLNPPLLFDEYIMCLRFVTKIMTIDTSVLPELTLFNECHAIKHVKLNSISLLKKTQYD